MAKNQRVDKEVVRLREKALANGSISLYLDIYLKGKRDYEFLRLYLVPEKTSADREKNRETLKLANAVKAKRIVEIQNQEYGFQSAFKMDTLFLDYVKNVKDERNSSKGNYGNWDSAELHLRRYCKPSTTFRDIDSKFIEGFKSYLQKARTKSDQPLSQNTQHCYFNKLKACLNQAVLDRIIPPDASLMVESPKAGEPIRDFLLFEELRALEKVQCRYPVLRRAFLFSCLTGIRWGDVQKMTWKEVQNFNGGTRIVFKQNKTGGQEYLDIPEEAVDYMGKRGDLNQRVFLGLKYSAWHNMELQKWVTRAGIHKDITFHCGRHSFAVNVLLSGTDLYTLSKMLGHKHVKTTEIYGKIVDSLKIDAVKRMPKIKEEPRRFTSPRALNWQVVKLDGDT